MSYISLAAPNRTKDEKLVITQHDDKHLTTIDGQINEEPLTHLEYMKLALRYACDLMNSKHVEEIESHDNKCHLYPPDRRFQHSYDCLKRHHACFWSFNESSPDDDRDRFASADERLQDIVLHMVGCIRIGDSVVLSKLSDRFLQRIVAEEVRAMLTDQASREFTHKIMYGKMLHICKNLERIQYFYSDVFADTYMGRFDCIVEKYRNSPCMDVRTEIYFIMICEKIMFAPMFQTICYLATLGLAPHLCESNAQVMRDENIHYHHARGLLSGMRDKLRLSIARSVLHDFVEVVEYLIEDIIGDYVSPDNLFHKQHVLSHFRHVVFGFMDDNTLFFNDAERDEMKSRYGTSPATDYMELLCSETRVNLMESVNTLYRVAGSGDVTADIDFNNF